MAASNKNIVITPFTGNTTALPSIVYTGNANYAMTQFVAEDNSIFWSNPTGQLFSISNNLTTGTIFSVNDISGIPFISVNASGNVSLVPLGGANVGIGTASPQVSLDVYGNARVSGGASFGNISLISNIATTDTGTGTLVVSGNVGIGGNVNMGQSIAVTNSTQQFSVRINGSGQLEFVHNRYASAAGPAIMIIDDDTQFVQISGNAIVSNGIRGGNLSITNTTAATSSTTGALTVAGGVGIAGNVYANTYFGTANTAFNASNLVITSTNTNSTFYPAFVEGTGGNLGIRADTGFTYNPSTETLTLQALASAAATTLSVDSGTTGALNIGTSANAKNITIGNSTGATRLFVNAGTGGTTLHTGSTGFVQVQATAAPTVDMLRIVNTGFPVATAGISALQINYVGGAAAVESSSGRIDLTPSGTPGSTWNGFRMVGNAAAASVTMNAVKVDNITASAGSNNALWIGSGWGNVINLGNSILIRGDGSYVGRVNNINVISTTTNATFYPAFFETTSGALAPRVDTALTYNPTTDALTAGQFIPSSSTAPSTGIFLPAANTLGFSTNSGEKMRIDSTGNLSIGTTSVLNAIGSRTTLSLNGGGTESQIALGAGGTLYTLLLSQNTGTSLYSSAGTMIAGTTTANNFSLVTTNSTRMLINSAGNVGIGTSTPQGNLHVMGNLWLSNNAAFIGGIRFPDGTFQTTAATAGGGGTAAFSASNITVTSTTTNATFYPAFFEATSGNIGARVDTTFTYNPSTDALTAGQFIPSSSTAPANGMFLPASNTLGFATNSSEKVRIDTNGRLGIGTVSPTSNLHVMGNITISNSAGLISGITFSDGTYQSTAPRTVQTTFTFTTANSTTTTFALSPYTSTNSYIQVFVNGVYQPTNTWSWSTTNLVLNQPAPNGATVEVTVYTSLNLTAGNNFVQTTSTATNATFYPVFTSATSGAQGVNTDGDLTYNPSTNLLTAGAINVTSTTVPTNGMFLPAANTLGFSANGGEDMRIDPNGNVSIGTTTTSARLRIDGSATNTGLVVIDDSSASNGATLSISATSSAAGVGIAMFGNGATTPNKYLRTVSGQFQIVNSAYTATPLVLTDAGALSATGEITAYSSDGRLKGNVSLIPDALSRVLSIDGVTFDWLPETESLGFIPSKKRDVGVIAQRVLAVLPEAVALAPFDRDPHDPTKSKSGESYLTVQYEKLTVLLIEAIKEQQRMIERHETRICDLEKTINGMQGSMS